MDDVRRDAIPSWVPISLPRNPETEKKGGKRWGRLGE